MAIFTLPMLFSSMQITGINNISFNTRKTAPPAKANATGDGLSFGAISSFAYGNLYYLYPNYNGSEPDSKVLNTLETLANGSNVADIGAGDGRNALALAKRGLNVSAFEICKAGRKLITKRAGELGLSNVSVSEDDILKKPFNKKFDAAVMAHVSQHFTDEDMEKAFKNISESLKPGGVVIFDALIEKNGSIEANTPEDIGRGDCHFPMNTIEQLANKHGFNIKEVSGFSEKPSSCGSYFMGEWGYSQLPKYIEKIDTPDTSYLPPELQVYSSLQRTMGHLYTPVVRPVELKWIVLEKK